VTNRPQGAAGTTSLGQTNGVKSVPILRRLRAQPAPHRCTGAGPRSVRVHPSRITWSDQRCSKCRERSTVRSPNEGDKLSTGCGSSRVLGRQKTVRELRSRNPAQ
jgi:hypothetical protein